MIVTKSCTVLTVFEVDSPHLPVTMIIGRYVELLTEDKIKNPGNEPDFH